MIEGGANKFRSPEEEKAAQAFETGEKESSVEEEKREPFDAVIVLGMRLDEGSPVFNLNEDAQLRTRAAADMLRKGLARRIIFTGGRTNPNVDGSEASKMKEYLQDLLRDSDISPESIEENVILEDQATNTIENIANVCNIVDQNKEQFQSLAVLTNDYHQARAVQLNEKFGLKTEGVGSETVLARNPDNQQILNDFLSSPDYAKKSAGERRWSEGLKHGEEGGIPRYWFPQAMAVDNSDRLFQIMASLYGPAFAQKVGKEALLKHRGVLRETKRVMPPSYWGIKEGETNKFQIFLARHGESQHNVAETPYFAGGSKEEAIDVGLNEKGIESAKKVAEKLKNEGIEVIVHSDLKRSVETASVIAQELGYPVARLELDGLREVHVGELTGKTRDQVGKEGTPVAKRALDLFVSGDIRNINFPGGDSYQSACERTRKALEQVYQKYGDKAKIAIIGHGNENKVILSLMFPGDFERVNQLNLSHEAVVEVDAEIDNNGQAKFNNPRLYGETQEGGLI